MVTSDKTEEIGASIQQSLDHQSFTKVSFWRKDQITKLQSLYSSISIESKKVSINPLTLFLRLIVVVDRKPENETEDYFSYKLSPYPMSLFKDGAMTPAAKSNLKNFLLKDVSPSEPLPGTFKTIADGGAFLWCYKWKENDLFGDIFKKYVDAVRKFAIDVVVSALVFTDDTDNLCLLIHHVDTSQKQNNIYIKNMTKKKESNERVSYRFHNVIDNLDPLIIKFKLFAHAFLGCDTTSAIHNFGKQAIFPKLGASNKLEQIAQQFFLDNISLETIGNASICFFEELYSPGSSLQWIRKIEYHKMVSSDRVSIDPGLLPPSPRAAYYHGLWVYYLMNVWRQLSDDDIDPLSWGWKISNG